MCRPRLLDVGDQMFDGHRHVTIATPLLVRDSKELIVLGAVTAHLDIDTRAGDRSACAPPCCLRSFYCLPVPLNAH
jgi:hypothetical protein